MNFKNKFFSIKMVRRIIALSIVLIIFFVVGVFASKNDMNYITIKFSDDTEISVVTTKTNVSDILEENNIVLLPDEHANPDINSKINASKTIEIYKNSEKPIVIADKENYVSTEEILQDYVSISGDIIVEQVEIPFETVIKDVSQSGTETVDKVLQEGENGLKEITYKVKIENGEIIEGSKTFVSETIVKEPVDKIIQVSTKIVSRSSSYRANSAISLSSTVEGIEPTVSVMNVSAYTASTCGKSSSDPNYERTASGAIASSWYTIAAGPGVPMGTIVYIPYFASQPNGGWSVVEDRGGAITNSRIDVYMDTEAQCRNFGRRNLECYVY